ncbi:MAG: PDZ domain-containing protein [Niabella sp.]|jgi:predicted metalloprotease with PDZ domain|nr:MAG: PDZ domain-containing protein [Niabella sp.]
MKKFTIEQTDAQLLNTTADIRYHLHFERASQHLVQIVMEIDKCHEGFLKVSMPVWIPGSYKVRDMNQHQGNVICSDLAGNKLPMKWLTKNTLEINTISTNSVIIDYVYFANDLGVRTSHINRHHAFLVPAACLMFVENREEEIHHVYFYHDQSQWKNLTTSLSPVKSNLEDNNPIIYGALSYHILADSPIEIGNHKKTIFIHDDKIHEVAIISHYDCDINRLTDDIKKIVESQHKFWGELPYDRYTFMLLVADGQRGGLEHLRCNVSAADPQMFIDASYYQSVLGLLSHEFFHTWNIKRIRPIEYGPFNYHEENYSSMLWLAEGATSYYDDVLLYRAGLLTQEEFLSIGIASNLRMLDNVQGRFVMSVKDSSYLAWIKLYSMSPDANNRFPSYYLKGGVIFLLLDLHIFRMTEGKKSTDDVMRELWRLYKANPEKGITEEQFLEAIKSSTGLDCSDVLLSWLNGTDELQYNTYLNTIGLQWNELSDMRVKIYGTALDNDIWLGMSLKDTNQGVVITFVEDDSPAALAGFGIDDIIKQVNGEVVTSVTQCLEFIRKQHSQAETVKIDAMCDGISYSTEIAPKIRIYNNLQQLPNITVTQQEMFTQWLNR